MTLAHAPSPAGTTAGQAGRPDPFPAEVRP